MTLAVLGGGAVAINDDAIGPDSYFRYTFPDDRDYVISVTDHLGQGGPAYFYRIEFLPVQPSATISIPKVALFSQERQTVSVPRGGRMATLVTVARANFGGDVVLGAEGLPAGVALKAENMPANLDTIPVVFEADGKAELAGKVCDFTLRHVDAKHPRIDAVFRQSVELVTGGPGQSVYWAPTVEKAVVAVTEEAPYNIEIVEPKSPLVQNGSMQLKVRATRKAGFTGPITVFPLFNPPGVGSGSGSVIQPNATETTIPMNAAGNAQVRKWKTAVIAVGDAGKGPVWVSSQLATLDVAPPFVAANIERGAVEQGKETDLLVKLQQVTPFEGKAKVRLIGLPFKVTAPEVEVTKDAKEAVFKIATDKASPAGTHRNLFCQVVLTLGGEEVVGNTGSSELRIDVPIVRTAPAPPPPVAPKAEVKTVVNQPPPKRLTRLEKLRLEQEERERMAKDGKQPAPPPPEKK